MKLNHLLLMLALTGSPGTCLAQQDRLPVAPASGTLDLSEAFGPGQLDVAFAAPGATPCVASVTLRLGARVTTLPACLVERLPSRQMAQISAAQAWNHEESGPSRLSLTFVAPEAVAASRRADPVVMLFDVRTAKLADIHTFTIDGEERSRRYVSLDIAAICPPQDLDAVFDPAARIHLRKLSKQ
ncbi:hypothetical protein [Massilia genomosp. 1]|uniref:Uncharacterized protein n=1 Tax=Massilia genomosp. 1 TaxID=2609280 RepID=A0ABX0MLJ2_9BURK|nr:hypothetical protein [Massilia genomosp. 1]NHZ63660.1 hypothetical protein [Massilia genomosp. 1]